MSPPYGFWNQGETWGSQNGLTMMWPWIQFTFPGPWGPQKSVLNAGIFPNATSHNYTKEKSWYGTGEPLLSTDADIDWKVYPWSSATGFIGMTFGATGFVSTGGVQDLIDQYSWIPNKYRTFYPARSWRAVDFLGISGSEYLLMSTGVLAGQCLPSPWIKRKINFVGQELKGVYSYLGSRGFTMAHWECDDEYYGYYDFRSIGQPNGDSSFLQKYVYPSNTSSGSTWYASFNGICAAPDSLIAEGITCMRSFLLGRGWTTNPAGFKYVDGITVAGYGSSVPGNIAASGSAFQFLTTEYTSDMSDWTSYMWNDLVNDFKNYNGLTANNSMSGNYGYFKSNVAVHDYYNPDSSHANNYSYVTDLLTRKSSDYVPYKAPTNWMDIDINNYYSFMESDAVAYVGRVRTKRVGDIDDITVYGSLDYVLTDQSYSVLDRNLDYRGGSYGFNTSGITFGKSIVPYWIMWSKFARLNSFYPSQYPTLNQRPRKIIPANFLGTTLSQQLIDLYSCADLSGNCIGVFRKYDPIGACGSTGCLPERCSFDRAPTFISWHLNPVWGINPSNFTAGSTYGPANYVPLYGTQILNGVTAGSVTISYLGSGVTTWNYTHFDPCGNIFPGNTLPAQTLLKHYWTHWYPIAFMGLLNDVKMGRSVARTNVSEALYQRYDPVNHPGITGSLWNGIQKPINTWISIQQWSCDYSYDSSYHGAALVDSTINNKRIYFYNYYTVPQGISYGYFLETYQAVGITYMVSDSGPMYYENIRHQYLNKTRRYSYWNPISYYYNTTSDGQNLPSANNVYPLRYDAAQTTPTLAQGITCMGICGYLAMKNARKVNTVLNECQTLGNGIVYETMYLAPINMDERSYLMSGAQLVDGSYLWRVTFAHPATQSPITIRGSVSGITTAYNINGVTDYINIQNSKFGVWWTSKLYEIPIVENPPVSEAERLGLFNLPTNPAFVYNPFTMKQAQVRPPIQAFAWAWPGSTGNSITDINNWISTSSLYDNVTPIVSINAQYLNDDWKDGLS